MCRRAHRTETAEQLIIAAETLTGILCWIGGFSLMRRLGYGARSFNWAERRAIGGLTLAFLVWQIGFMSVGGEWSGMWVSSQRTVCPMRSDFFITILAVLIFVAQQDAELV